MSQPDSTASKPAPRRRFGPGRKVYLALVPVFVLSLAYFYVMQPSNVQGLLEGLVRDHTRARLSLKVERASLLYGFDFRELRLRAAADDTPLFYASRVKLSWFLPSVLIGHIGVRELAIDDPHLHLIRTGAQWNWSAMSGKRTEATPEPEPETVDETPLPDAIDLFLNFRVYANLKINRFAMDLQIQEPGAQQDLRLNLRNVNLRFAAITEHFSEIPLSLDLLNLFDSLLLAVNPYEPLRLDLRMNAADAKAPTLRGSTRLNYFLFRETDQGVTEFASRLILNTSGLKLRRAAGDTRNLALGVRYDTLYDASRDRLLLPIVEVGHAGARWLSMDGEVHNATTSDRSLRLDVQKSRIDLGPIGGVLTTLFGDGRGKLLDGVVNIDRLALNGELERLNLSGKLGAKQIRIAPGSRIETLRDFKVDLTALVDLYRILPIVQPPPDYAPDQNLAFGFFHRLRVPELRAVYGQTRVKGDAAITPEDGVKADLDVQGFLLESILPEILRGRADARVKLASPESFKRMDFDGQVRLRNGRYFLDRSRSGLHNLFLKANGRLRFDDVFQIDVARARLTAANPEGERMAALDGGAQIQFPDGQQVYNFDVKQLKVDYPVLHTAFPGSIRYILAPYKLYLSKGVELKSRTDMRIGDGVFALDVQRGSRLKVPFLKIDDLDVEADLRFGDNEIRMRPVKLRGLRGALAANAAADLKKNAAGRWVPNATVDLKVARDSLFRVHENIALQGSVELNAKINADQARGKLDIESLNLEYDQGSCANRERAGPECYRIAVRDMNLDLPFEHELAPKSILSLAKNTGRDYLDTYGRRGQANLTVQSVASSHRPNGEFSGQSANRLYYYVGHPEAQGAGSGNEPAAAASLTYRNNIAYLNWLRLSTYQQRANQQWQASGSVDARSGFFNLADLNSENMEFGVNLQIQDLDLEPFLPGRNRYEAEISGDLRMTTSSLKDFLYHTEGIASIHEIQDDFSGFVTRILLPTQVAALIVNNTLSIPRIRAEVKGGLVYSYVSVRRGGALGYLVKPGGEEIKQERMPIAQFLERARSELGTRQRDTAEDEPEP